MPCKICKHSDRQAIDAVLLEGWPSLRMIGTQYGVSKDSLLRHYRAHVPDTGDDSGGDEESEARQVVEIAEEKKVPEARQMAEVVEQKKEPEAPALQLWTPEQWEEFSRGIAELYRGGA